MLDIIKNSIDLGIGITSASMEQVESLVNQFIEKGQLAKEEKPKVIKAILEKLEKYEAEYKERTVEFVTEALGNFGYATQKDIKDLKEIILKLEKKINKISESLVPND